MITFYKDFKLDIEKMKELEFTFLKIRTHLKILKYVWDFEELRLQNLNDFSSLDKLSLVRSLWLNYNDAPLVFIYLMPRFFKSLLIFVLTIKYMI